MLTQQTAGHGELSCLSPPRGTVFTPPSRSGNLERCDECAAPGSLAIELIVSCAYYRTLLSSSSIIESLIFDLDLCTEAPRES